MNELAIKIEDLGKKYSLGTKQNTLRDTLSNLFSLKDQKKDFWALKDINLEIKRGESIGIIGRNGAGKSTLLKVLSKITTPTTGKVTIHGRLTSLLEVGTGFHHELTGRENIYLNGSLLGMRKREIKDKLDEIIHFSEIEKFIDTPVKHYSSGMYVRLAFSVAAHLNFDILLIDEVLAVGDSLFQQKCINKMNNVSSNGKTLLVVSHDSNMIQNLTSKSILLENGSIKAYEDSLEIYNHYSSSLIDTHTKVYESNSIVKKIHVSYLENLKIYLDYQIPEKVKIPHFCFMINDENGNTICANNPKFSKINLNKTSITTSITIDVKNPLFRFGKYFLSIWLADGNQDIFKDENCVMFSISNIEMNDKHLGKIIPHYNIIHK